MKGMCRLRFKFICKVIPLLILLTPSIVFAQTGIDNPCDGADPLNPPPGCDVPLDTFVWLLVFTALIFGAWHLYRQQKLQNRL